MFTWDRCTDKEDLVRLGLDVGWGVCEGGGASWIRIS